MRYMLLMYGVEVRWTDEERTACMVESLRVIDEFAAEGKFLDAAPLQSVTTATTVRVRDGRPLVTDGPFAETVEQLGGYYVLDLADLDEAIAVAARLPPALKGAVEIRPLLALDGLPPTRPHAFEPDAAPYLLLCYADEAVWEGAGPDAKPRAMAEARSLVRRLYEEGRYLSASPLHPAPTATSVRVRDGRRTITDGPFAETHEVLAGYYLVLAGSRDEAARVAAGLPGARVGAIEVRPLFDLSAVRKSAANS